MQLLGLIVSQLLDVRAHIPNQPGFGSGTSRAANGSPVVRAIAAFVVAVACLSAVLWLAVRLTIGLL